MVGAGGSGRLSTAAYRAEPRPTVLSFTSWLVVGIHRQAHRSSIVDPMNVTPRTNLVRILCVVSAKCDTRSAIVAAFRPPRPANAMDPYNEPKRKRQYAEQQCRYHFIAVVLGSPHYTMGLLCGPAHCCPGDADQRCMLPSFLPCSLSGKLASHGN
jgi:hypothetical protein